MLRDAGIKRKVAWRLAALLTGIVLLALYVWMGRPVPSLEDEPLVATRPASPHATRLPAGCPPLRLEDVTAAAGIRFRHFWGQRSSQLPEDLGSGAAWCDYDGDGWPDLFLPNETGPLGLDAAGLARSPARCALYRNNGDGTFSDVTDESGLGQLRGWFMGAAWGDYDNDGWEDLFVTAYGRNRLFHNNGDGTFREATRAAGVGTEFSLWTGATWCDYDRDGRLDLYVCGYVRYTAPTPPPVPVTAREIPATLDPAAYPAQTDQLFHNEGGGRFREVAASVGVADASGRSLAAAWCDLDDDGWPDLYVANQVSRHRLYHNTGHGRFKDESVASQACDFRGGTGIAVGDWNGDGGLGLFVTTWMAEADALYANRTRHGGPIRLADVAERAGLGNATIDVVGWGTAFLDLDDDGRLDLVLANGHSLEDEKDRTHLIAMKNLLFWNGGPQRGFVEVEEAASPPLAEPNAGRGVAAADFDRDGFADLIVTRNGASPLLLRNRTGPGRHWLQVEMVDAERRSGAPGARLLVEAGELRYVRQVNAQPSFLSEDEKTQTLGLGGNDRVGALQIRWPDGAEERLEDLPADVRVHLQQARLR